MKPIKTLLTILFVSLLSAPSWSVTLGDLVEREGLYYKQFTDIPFTGKVDGDKQGSFKNGQQEGAWVGYFENGQLRFKENYKNGKEEGEYISYWGDGRLLTKGNFKNGKATVAWVVYLKDGTVLKEWTGTFKDGVKISD